MQLAAGVARDVRHARAGRHRQAVQRKAQLEIAFPTRNYDPDRAYHDAVAKPEEWYTSALAAFGIGSDD